MRVRNGDGWRIGVLRGWDAAKAEYVVAMEGGDEQHVAPYPAPLPPALPPDTLSLPLLPQPQTPCYLLRNVAFYKHTTVFPLRPPAASSPLPRAQVALPSPRVQIAQEEVERGALKGVRMRESGAPRTNRARRAPWLQPSALRPQPPRPPTPPPPRAHATY